MRIDMEPIQSPEKDDEGRMAKADLYKLANYSLKLFKQLDNHQQLEGWVQAKITKAADYVASVYHYMEYEMKFSEYGKAIEDSDVYTESQKRELKNKLFEAKEKVKELKKAQAEKIKKKEEKVDEATGFRAGDKKKGKVEKSEKKQYFVKLEKEGRTKGMTMVADEGESESELRDRAKRDNRGWTVTSVRVKDSGSGEEVSEGKRMKDKKSSEGNKFTGNLMKARAAGKKEADLDGDGDMEKVKEGSDWPGTKEYKAKHGTEKERHQAKYGKDEELEKEYESKKKKGGYGNLGASGADTEEEPAKDKPGRGRKKSNETAVSNPVASKTNIPATAKTSVPGMRATQQDMKKAHSSAALGEAKPSAGMTAKEKSAVVKKAQAGKDIGKPGKGFEKVEKAAKAGGAKDPKAVAAAAMWKQQAKK